MSNNTVTPLHAHNAPFSPTERKQRQIRFLQEFSESGNVKQSCKVADISRQTYYRWCQEKTFAALLAIAKEEAVDTLEYAAYEQSTLGIEEPVMSLGQVMYDYEPVLDKDGNQIYDAKGKPMMQRGNRVTVRKFAPQLLITLLKAHAPEKYRDKSQIDATVNVNHSGSLTIDTGKMTDSELSQLKQLALSMRNREEQSNG